jgi:hypothetical protein
MKLGNIFFFLSFLTDYYYFIYFSVGAAGGLVANNAARRAPLTVFRNNIAMVIGPTPPGTYKHYYIRKSPYEKGVSKAI